MMKMNARVRRTGRLLSQAALGTAMLLTTGAALAVKDLPGGPAVNQINLHPPVTKIAADQMWLHNFMLIVCLGAALRALPGLPPLEPLCSR